MEDDDDDGGRVLLYLLVVVCTHVEDLGQELPVVRGLADPTAGVLVAALVAGLAAVEEELEVPAGAGAQHGHVVEVGRGVLLHRLDG